MFVSDNNRNKYTVYEMWYLIYLNYMTFLLSYVLIENKLATKGATRNTLGF